MIYILDDWQKTALTLKGNVIIYGGRQIGKSEIEAMIQGEYLINNSKCHLLIVSGVERQANELYLKILRYVEEKAPKLLMKGKEKPLKTVFKLKNGSICRTEAIGLDGSGARRHTLTRVVFEEMQLIPEEAYAAITPMLLTTGGDIHMLGTAWATEGFVYERLRDPSFTVLRIDAENVAEKRPEPMRTVMLKWLLTERERMTAEQYAREYKAIPTQNLRQIFSDKLIAQTLTLNTREKIRRENKHSIGIDPAGFGEDTGAISILDVQNKDQIEQTEFIITEKKLTTQTVDLILNLNERYNFKKIYVDDGGIGFGVFSELRNDTKTKNKTVALNNSSRSIDVEDDEKRKKVLKEDLYINLLALMERGKIKLLNIPEIRESLKSCHFEYHEKTKKLIITSSYNHPTESIVRAAWYLQDCKSLNLWASYSKDKQWL